MNQYKNSFVKRALGIFLALLMVFSAAPLTGGFTGIKANAAYNEGAEGYADYSEFNISAEEAIGCDIDYLMDFFKKATVDQLCSFIMDIADYFVEFANEQLIDDYCNGIMNEWSTVDDCMIIEDGLFKVLLSEGGEYFCFNSIDGVAEQVYTLISQDKLGGMFDLMDASALSGLKREDGDLRFIYALVDFIGDNADIIAGIINNGIDIGDLFDYVNIEINENDSYGGSVVPGEKIPINEYINTELSALDLAGMLLNLLSDISKVDAVVDSETGEIISTPTPGYTSFDEYIRELVAPLEDVINSTLDMFVSDNNFSFDIYADSIYDIIFRLVDAVLLGTPIDEILRSLSSSLSLFTLSASPSYSVLGILYGPEYAPALSEYFTDANGQIINTAMPINYSYLPDYMTEIMIEAEQITGEYITVYAFPIINSQFLDTNVPEETSVEPGGDEETAAGSDIVEETTENIEDETQALSDMQFIIFTDVPITKHSMGTAVKDEALLAQLRPVFNGRPSGMAEYNGVTYFILDGKIYKNISYSDTIDEAVEPLMSNYYGDLSSLTHLYTTNDPTDIVTYSSLLGISASSDVFSQESDDSGANELPEPQTNSVTRYDLYKSENSLIKATTTITTKYEEDESGQLVVTELSETHAVAYTPSEFDLAEILNPFPDLSVESLGLTSRVNGGLIGEINHVLYNAMSSLFNVELVNEMQLRDGGNEYINYNIERLLSVPWNKLIDMVFGLMYTTSGSDANTDGTEGAGLDLSEYIDLLKYNNEGLDGYVVKFIKAFAGEALGINNESITDIAQIIIHYLSTYPSEMIAGIFDTYNERIYDATGEIRSQDSDYWINLLLDIFVDAAVAFMNENTDINIPVEEYRQAGWDWDDFLDEIVDWAMYYIEGVVVNTTDISCERGVLDGNGPIYKISVILDSLFAPLDLFANCGKTYSDGAKVDFDIGVFLLDNLLTGVLELDIGKIISIFEVNASESNVFYTNAVIPACLKSIQQLVNAVFPDTIEDKHIQNVDSLINNDSFAEIAANLLRAISNRKKYLVPSAVEIIAKIIYTFSYSIRKESVLTITAPESVNEPSVYLCGKSIMTGDELSLYANGELVDTITSENGIWSYTYNFPQGSADGTAVSFYVKSTINSGSGLSISSNTVTVTYDSGAPLFKSISISHHGDSLSFDQDLFAPKYYLMYDAAYPMSFVVNFENTEAINRLRIVSTTSETGEKNYIEAFYDGSKWLASGFFTHKDDTSFVPGKLSFEVNGTEMAYPEISVVYVVRPIGHIYEYNPANRVSGATVTVQGSSLSSLANSVWNALQSSQINPQQTRADGTFAWELPMGYWTVEVAKEGYTTKVSDSFIVPLSSEELSIPLVSTQAPQLISSSFDESGISVIFDKYVNISEFSAIADVTDSAGNEIPGTWSATDAYDVCATSFKFVPETALVPESGLKLIIGTGVHGYNDVLVNPCSIILNEAVEKIMLTTDAPETITYSDTGVITVTAQGLDGLNVTATVSDSNMLDLDSSIVAVGDSAEFAFEAVGVGTVYITFAADSELYEPITVEMNIEAPDFSCGENLTWSFDNATGTLTISGTGAMKNWTNGADVPWNRFSALIKKVVLDPGVTTVGANAFNGCQQLTAVEFGENSQLTTIGANAFAGCSALPYIVLPDNLTDVGEDAFINCLSLKTILIYSRTADLDDSGLGFAKQQGEAATAISGVTIYGYRDSTAEAYADNNSIVFVALDACEHENTTVINSADATCTQTGYSGDRYCDDCETVILSGSVIPALGHEYSVYVSSAAGNCQTVATATYKCSRCEVVEVRQGDIGAHRYSSVVTPPSCTSQGYTTHTCSICNHVLIDTYTNALSHNYSIVVSSTDGDCQTRATTLLKCSYCDATVTVNGDYGAHNYTSQIVAPTCSEQGYTIHTCSICDATYNDDYTSTTHTGGTATCTSRAVCSLCNAEYGELAPHNYTLIVTQPSCTEQGHTAFTCSVCGDEIIDDYTAPTGHIGGSATCLKKAICSVCGTEYGELGSHSYTSEVTLPTCTEQGYTTHTCSLCAYEYVDSYTSVMHTGGTATCCSKAICELCGTEYGEFDADNHVGFETHVKESTCSASGYTLITCTGCEKKISYESLPRLTHDYSQEISSTPGDCMNRATVLYKCSRCESIKIVDGEFGAHDYSQLISKTEGTCLAKEICEYQCTVCETIILREGDYGTHNYVELVVAPTCLEQGYTIHTCSVCGDRYTDTYTDVIGHSGGTATCCDKAICTTCGVEYGELNPNNHTGSSEYTQPASCTVNGYRLVTCPDCGEEIEYETLNKLGHDFTVLVSSTVGTCIEKATSTYKCSRCDVTEVREGEYGSHSYTTTVTPPTCTEQGYTTHTCSVCNDTFNDTFINALGHTGGTATCCDKAICTTCGVEYGELNPNNHTGSSEYTQPASCTVNGYRLVTCPDCGEELEYETLNKLGHDFTVFVSSTVGTCIEKATSTYKCSRCDVTEVREGEYGSHSYTTTVTPPTCTEEGYTTHSCSLCGDMYNDTFIDMLGHDFTVFVSSTVGTCIEKATSTYKCSRCDVTEMREGEYGSHSYTTVVTPPTCTEEGYTTHSCSLCGDIYKDTYIDALGHIWSEWTVQTEATVYETGLSVRHCIAQGCTAKEEEVIPMLEKEYSEDVDTGIGVYYDEDDYEDVVEVVIEEQFDGSQYLLRNFANNEAYNIKTYVNGIEAQPSGKVTVKIPLPEDFNPDKTFVYHINSETGEREKMDITIKDNFIYFDTVGFSIYIVVDEGSLIEDECQCSCHKTGFFTRLFWVFVEYFYKLFGIGRDRYCDCGKTHW